MILKLFELRDSGTFIPIFAFQCRPTYWGAGDMQLFNAERYLLSRAGFDHKGLDDHVIIGRLECESPGVSQCTYDVHAHSTVARTFLHAHRYIEQHWAELESGAVIDVEFILKETAEPKISERRSHPDLG